VLTEGHGMPIEVAIDGANRHDMKLVRATIARIVVARPAPTEERPQCVCLDKGYDDDEVRATLRAFGFTAHVRSRGEESKEIAREAGKRARRWVVERSHNWLNRFRCVLIRWKKKPEHYLAFLHFACGVIAVHAAGLFG
jgi:transposase